MARTPNYGFEKRRREQERQAKKEAKARRREELKAAGITEEGELVGWVEGDEVTPTDGDANPSDDQP